MMSWANYIEKPKNWTKNKIKKCCRSFKKKNIVNDRENNEKIPKVLKKPKHENDLINTDEVHNQSLPENTRKQEYSEHKDIELVGNYLAQEGNKKEVLKNCESMASLISDFEYEPNNETETLVAINSHVIRVEKQGDLGTGQRSGQKIEKKENLLNRDLPKNYRSRDFVSGKVDIKCIDLKTAKCVLCLGLVSHSINISICSHVYCRNCLREWIQFSQHCPVCQIPISRFADNIRIDSTDDKIAIRSKEDYKVVKVVINDDYHTDSLEIAYLLDTYCLNRNQSKSLDMSIEFISAKLTYYELVLEEESNTHKIASIEYWIKIEEKRLKTLKKHRKCSEERFKDICSEIDPQVLKYWGKIFILRELANICDSSPEF